MNFNPELIAKIQKIHALAERGVGGEAENAKRILEAVARKHGLTEEDLSDIVGAKPKQLNE